MGTRGATTALISGIDIALWDIRGQALGVPIYELLGGPVREHVPLYTHFPYARTVEEVGRRRRGPGARRPRRDQDRPVLARRWAATAPATSTARSSAARGAPGVAMIAAIREAVGPDVEVLIDAHALYNVPTAVRLANRLAPYDITWFEEPVPARELRRAAPGARAGADAASASASGCTPASSSCRSSSSAWPTSSCRT